MRNFLWFSAGPLHAAVEEGRKRLEYCTLKVLMDEPAELITGPELAPPFGAGLTTASGIEKIAALTEAQQADLRRIPAFFKEARLLLLLERRAMLREKLTFEKTSDPHIRAMREHLFSILKSHGGLFKEVVDRMDALLYSLLTYRHPTGRA